MDFYVYADFDGTTEWFFVHAADSDAAFRAVAKMFVRRHGEDSLADCQFGTRRASV